MMETPGSANHQPGEFRGRPILSQNEVNPGGPQWHSRGYVPHVDSPGVIQHVMFHLADSMPGSVLDQFEAEIQTTPEAQQDAKRRKRIEGWIDAGHGCCLFRDACAAQLTQDALLRFDGVRYSLLAWAIMPNHVHVLIQQIQGWKLSRVVATWKSYTGRQLMPMMLAKPGMEGARHVWCREFKDRFIRDQRHLRTAVDYIHNNPVAAGLCAEPEAWPWSSAHLYIEGVPLPGNAGHQPGKDMEV